MWFLLILRRDGSRRVSELEEVAAELNELSALALGLLSFPHRIELLLAEQWGYGEHRTEIAEIMDQCTSMSWGSDLGVAVFSGDRAVESVTETAPSSRRWVETVLDRGFSRLIEITPQMWEGAHPAGVPGELLRRHLDRLTENQHRTLALLGSEEFCVVWKTRPSSYVLNALLDLELQPPLTEAEALRIIVVDVPTGKQQVKLFRAGLGSESEGPVILATLRCIERAELREARQALHVPSPLAFETELELLFFATWLRRRLESPRRTSQIRHSVLITNSFLEGEPHLACAASGDIAAIKRHLEPGDYCVIEPRLTLERLLENLEGIPAEMQVHPLIWIHLGHGEADGSLRDSQGSTISADRCLNVFGASSVDLKAALLLACNSDDLARSLAAGLGSVKLATAFRGEVPNAECRDLIRILVPALLSPKEADIGLAWSRFEQAVLARAHSPQAIRFPLPR